MRCTTLTAFTLLGCLLCSPAGAGELYKWTDEKGRTHYSDQPPPEAQKEVERRELPSAPNSEAPKEAATESPECQLARKNLKVFQSNPVVLMDINGDGENERLEGEELQRYAERAKQQITTYCIAKPTEQQADQQD